MNKIKVLLVNESSYLSTGYARYGHNLLTQLHNDERFEIAEMGTFFDPNNNKLETIPWKFYPNVLPQDAPADKIKAFSENKACQMGYTMFDDIALDFRADVVLNINDFWAQKFINNSVYRKCFKSLWMAPHDSVPQNIEWLEDMMNHDGVLGYTDWAIEKINGACPKVKTFGSASGAASPEFVPMNKDELKKSLGIYPESKFIGTTMRNQFRKLFPNLFSAFRKYLDTTKRQDVYLYCHTSYPDGSWNIPALIQEYGVSHKTLFTYICKDCKYVFPTFYTDIATCKRCGNLSARMPSTHFGVDTATLAKIYNLFDCYVQYSNSEGFGYPQIEATSCEVPLMATDYSAMYDVVRKVGGYPINVLGYQTEISTGCLRALPDDDHLVSLLTSFFNKPKAVRNLEGLKTRKLTNKAYSWEKTKEVWANAIISVYTQSMWDKPVNMHEPAEYNSSEMSTSEFAKWLIKDVYGKPEKLGSLLESTLVRDLNYGVTTGAYNADNISEDSKLFNDNKITPFSRQEAYNTFKNLGNELRIKEYIRGEVVGL